MNRSELQEALYRAAEKADDKTRWNYDSIEVKACEVVADALRAVADLLEEGVSDEAR